MHLTLSNSHKVQPSQHQEYGVPVEMMIIWDPSYLGALDKASSSFTISFHVNMVDFSPGSDLL